MPRIALFGTSPLPFEPHPVAGPALRTWQFARPLAEDGHDLAIFALRTAGCYPEGAPGVITESPMPRVAVRLMSHGAFSEESAVRAALVEFAPDAIVGAGSLLPTATAARHGDLAPVWADLFGDALSEIQSKGGVYGHESIADELFHAWKLLTATLVRGDRFSALSNPQRLALVGQLGLAGRLGAHNDGTDLVAHIPCGIEGRGAAPLPSREEAAARLGLHELAGESSFVAMWSGSYNTWTDPATLFEGVELAMAREPSLRFLSVGGGTEGYNPRLYADFLARVEASPHRARYIMRGWVPFAEMPAHYALADIGLNVDRFTYEGVLGSRNRVVQFMDHGVAVLSTALSELTVDLAARGLMRTFALGDPGALAGALCAACRVRGGLRAEGARAAAHVREAYNFGVTTQALRAWCASPRRSPDNAELLARKGTLPGPGGYMTEPQRLMDSAHFLPWVEGLSQGQAPGVIARLSALGRKLKG